MRVIPWIMLGLMLSYGNAQAMVRLLSIDGSSDMEESDFVTAASLDVDGDGLPEIAYTDRSVQPAVLHFVELDGTSAWSFDLSRSVLCPTCSEEFDAYFYYLGDVDSAPAREAIIEWEDSGPGGSNGVAVVSTANNQVIRNFAGYWPHGVWDFNADGTDELVISAGYHFEVWGYDPAGCEEDTGTTPLDPLHLSPSRPSPAQSRAAVTLELRDSDEVALRVLDANGRTVRDLGHRVRTSGPQEVVWDGNDDAGRRVAAGTYFLQAVGHGSHESTRIVIAD